MHNIENKCKNFKNEGIFIYFAKSSLQNMIDSSVSMDCFCARIRFGNSYHRIRHIARIATAAEVHGWSKYLQCGCRCPDSCSFHYWSTMSTNAGTRWTLPLCACINQNTNGLFLSCFPSTNGDCGRFYTAKVAC